MAETRQEPSVLHGPPEEPIDWRTVDRLILLMSLTLTKRMLRRRGRGMSDAVRLRVLDRIGKLIAYYRRP